MSHLSPQKDEGNGRRSSLVVLGSLHGPESMSPRTPSDEEILQAEAILENLTYGGDDIHDPELKFSTDEKPSSSTTLAAASPDPNMVSWDGPDDPANPQSWTIRRKWLITMVCSVTTLNATFASSAPSTATVQIIETFDVSSEVSYLITTVFLLGYIFGPLFWGPGSEIVGRRPIFRVTMVAFTLFHLGQTLAPNIETLLITRFISGFFAVGTLTIAGGIIADIWPAAGRGPATSLFTSSAFIGPALGPIVGGFIIESSLSWRWVFWVMMIFAGACTLIMLLILPETYAPILLLKKVKKLRKAEPEASAKLYAEYEKQDWSAKGVIHRTLYRPFLMLAMEPILVLITVYMSLVYGILYALFQALPIIFIDRRGFTIGQGGLIFIGVGLGTTIGAVINAFASAHYPQLIAKWKGFPPPEHRLFGAMIGGPAVVIGAFWLGWTGEYSSIPWYVPALSTLFIGMGICLIFISFLSYLVDTYLMYSASAFAVNTMIRSGVAAMFPLFTVQMFTKLGINWACTLLGLFSLLLAPIPFLFWVYGSRIRQWSTFTHCIDLDIAKQLQEEEEREKV